MIRGGGLAAGYGLPLVAAFIALALTAVAPVVHPEVFVEGPGPEQIEAAVRSYLYEWSPLNDPLMTLQSGVQVKSSNVNGVEVGGERYFYRPRQGFSADPITRGLSGDYHLTLVMDPATDFETDVYRLK